MALIHTIGILIGLGTLVASVILYRGAHNLEQSIRDELSDVDE
ncbi:hypothetical protein [Fundidesulfovibrio magnetotacticus]|nr:hypothetical protein [Fundidesulfovibrio magnetotacticus]